MTVPSREVLNRMAQLERRIIEATRRCSCCPALSEESARHLASVVIVLDAQDRRLRLRRQSEGHRGPDVGVEHLPRVDGRPGPGGRKP